MLLLLSVVSAKGEVSYEPCGCAYSSKTVTPNKSKWWAFNIPAEQGVLICSDQACCKKTGS